MNWLIDEKIGTPCKNYRPTASRCELMIRLVKANYGLSCESFHSSLLIERSKGLKTSAISAKLSWILMTIASGVLYICAIFWLLAHKSQDLSQVAITSLLRPVHAIWDFCPWDVMTKLRYFLHCKCFPHKKCRESLCRKMFPVICT